ncbi:MAG TPA: hypothetical protein VMS55_06760 [Myxococcota bacterium]|nr:hypothetical protein [Myxococcota bacterium]
MRRTLVWLVLLGAAGMVRAQEATVGTYALLYDVRIAPTERAAEVAIHLTDPSHLLRWVRFDIDPKRQLDWKGDGQIHVEGNTVEWTPPKLGGVLRYSFRIDRLRNAQSYDARCSENWAIFRGDDLVPPARVRSAAGSESRARLRLRLPKGWTSVVPWRLAADGSYAVENPDRHFDRPVGWIGVGRLAVARETVSGVRLAIAGPQKQRVPRLDRLALLRWTLPELRGVIGASMPERVVVLGAGDPMWRGGLSGPRSLFLHASRPLIDNDGTSPLLHELVHASLRIQPGDRGDWIVEGTAELYSLEMLRRSKTLSKRRYEHSLARLALRGSHVQQLEGPHSTGDTTAKAVTVLHALDLEIRQLSGGAASLDGVVAKLAEQGGTVDTQRLRALSEQVAGASLERFFARNLPAAAKAPGDLATPAGAEPAPTEPPPGDEPKP